MAIVCFPLIPLISGGSVILNPLLCRTIVNTPIFISFFMLGGGYLKFNLSDPVDLVRQVFVGRMIDRFCGS